MPRRPLYPQTQFAPLLFPRGGIDISLSFERQRPETTPVGNNVRLFEPTTNRARGGSRAGLSKYLTAQVAGTDLIQEVAGITGVGYTPPGGIVQTSSSGRVITLVAVSGGNVFSTSPGGTSWTAAVNGTAYTPPLIASGVVRSAVNNQKLWFADGTHWCYFDPKTNTVTPWVATKGTLPVDVGGNTPRLICTWRGRTVVSGLLLDGQNWFMSAIGDPTDFDYAPTDSSTGSTISAISPSQAIDGNNSPLGLIGDIVTTLIPYTDDVLITGGDHTIYQFNGDPMDGGKIDLISDAIGMAWGAPWCKGPDGTLYFLSNRTGIYAMLPGQGPPQRISQPIEQLLLPVNTGANTIRLVWDDRFQGLWAFISPTLTQTDTTHYFFEARSGAWWQCHFDTYAHNPLCCCTFDGNLPGDRVVLIGSWDGYVRSLDYAATTDDGTAIASSVVIGPLDTPNLDDLMLYELQCHLGAASGTVQFAVYIGPTAEIALASAAVLTGTWSAGRNPNNYIRRAGHAVWVKLTSSNPWQLEQIRAKVASKGKVRMRSAT